MPKSKRAKMVHLSKTATKGREAKSTLVERIRDAVDMFKHVYVFSYHNMRTSKFKDARGEMKDGRFFLGKNKVMRLALGKSSEDEYRENLHVVGNALKGNVGLLLTNREMDDVLRFFGSVREVDFARSGNVATRTVKVSKGPLEETPFSMAEELRKLGLPIELRHGVVNLIADKTICKEGDVLTPEQCRLLKHFGVQMSEFAINVFMHWCDGEVEELEVAGAGAAAAAAEEEEEEEEEAE